MAYNRDHYAAHRKPVERFSPLGRGLHGHGVRAIRLGEDDLRGATGGEVRSVGCDEDLSLVPRIIVVTKHLQAVYSQKRRQTLVQQEERSWRDTWQ